ncbi:AraC family transcriptional regulator [Chryseobacterium sp. KMC2]|uniref:AraC family transcriptional regulator n=1 Tax=Chryseobacterium sp. KMC2 TaxID=2800705 RepID=UPI001923EC9A|nr:AraC family transcriptional regulator [Chryseobacterium sp. KMC2]MBL3547282.1 AraC family transcriptional regulator [Chryseobacterium sp. KMC2]
MKSILFILLFLLSLALPAQNKSDFNKVYTKTYIKTSHEDFKKAMNIADSLYSASEEPYFKAKSLMLSATLLQEAGDVKKAVDYAIKAEEICEKSKDHVQTAEIYGFLATQFRKLKLYNQSISYIRKAGEQAEQIENTTVKSTILGLIIQEHASYEIDQKNYKKAILLIEKSQVYFRENKTNKELFLASNERLLADSFYDLGEYDQSLSHYTIALELLGKFPDNFLKGFIYNGISAIYIKKRNVKYAKTYVDLAQKIADKTQYLDLKKEIYKTSQEYYVLEKNIEKFSQLKRKEDAISEVISEKKNTFINNEQTKLLDKNNALYQNNLLLILASCGSLTILGIMFFFYYRKDSLLKAKLSLLEDALKSRTKANHKTTENIKMIKPEVEEKILKKLEAFENSNMFVQKNISLSVLSIYCNTNTKYLSIVINSHKQKDFNNYINELRIKYLVYKIKTEPQYLKYKIVSLAELAGFSTQSKFIEAFKKEMSVTPSLFIKSIEDQAPNSSNEE